MKFDAARIHVLSDLFVAVAVVLLKLPNKSKTTEKRYLLGPMMLGEEKPR